MKIVCARTTSGHGFDTSFLMARFITSKILDRNESGSKPKAYNKTGAHTRRGAPKSPPIP